MDLTAVELERWREYESSFPDAVNRDEFKDDLVDEPEPDFAGVQNGFQLVGHGEPKDANCGRFFSFKGCARVDLHNIVAFNSKDGSMERFSGKVFVHPLFHSCDRPSCPVCYKKGWAVRQARRIEWRLMEGSKHFGKAEHIIVGVPERDYGLSYEQLRCKAAKILVARGVVGGCLIFHAFRYRSFSFSHGGRSHFKGWYWSPHFHCLGFVSGGYGRCRGCHKGALECLRCDGFEGRTRKLFKKDGYIVKVKGERKSVCGTAAYQLNHASVKVGVERFHVVTWFGVCSYRKLKVTEDDRSKACPICGHVLVKILYFGSRDYRQDRNSPDYVSDFFAPMNEGHGDVWVEDCGSSFG